MRVVLITGHDGRSPRKVDFHFWADILVKRGHDVSIITAGFSRLTAFKKNPRKFLPPYNEWVEISDHLKTFTWCAPIHPCVDAGPLNILLNPIFATYPLFFPEVALSEIHDADLFIIECGPPILLVPVLANACPDAKFIYSVSDRMITVGGHPLIIESEEEIVPLFDSIRVPSELMIRDYPKNAPVHYIAPAVTKDKIDAHAPSPYDKPKNAICIGDMLFNSAAVEKIADSAPDWTIHLFGKGAKVHNAKPNIVTHGEVGFDVLIPYLKHADIGIAPYNYLPASEYLCQSSLKMLLYKYCHLPIIAPDFVSKNQPHIFTFDHKNPQSAASAFKKAIAFDRNEIDVSDINTWETMLDKMLATVDIKS